MLQRRRECVARADFRKLRFHIGGPPADRLGRRRAILDVDWGSAHLPAVFYDPCLEKSEIVEHFLEPAITVVLLGEVSTHSSAGSDWVTGKLIPDVCVCPSHNVT